MNLNRLIVVLVVLITGIFVVASDSYAGKPDKCSPWPECKDGGEPPPPPPPPAECNDPSPSFTYSKEIKRRGPSAMYIASKDNCIHSFIISDTGPTSTHMTVPSTVDGSVNGVFIWKEDPGDLNVEQLRRADFSVNAAGELTLWPIDDDPLDLGDPVVPDGDTLHYSSFDIWGDSDHDELYLVVTRVQGDTSGGGSHSLRIYNLNDLSDKRELYLSEDYPGGYTSNWSCPEDTAHPQAVAGCYRASTPKWNPTGTAIYIQDELQSSYTPEISSDWGAALRLRIERGGPISSWGVSGPQIVYTGTTTDTTESPSGSYAMPRSGLTGFTDLIFQHAIPRGMLDVEACVTLFTPSVSDPDPDIAADLWVNCLVDTDPFGEGQFDTGDARGIYLWLSPTEIAHHVREKRVHIYKTNMYTGESTKLVDSVGF